MFFCNFILVRQRGGLLKQEMFYWFPPISQSRCQLLRDYILTSTSSPVGMTPWKLKKQFLWETRHSQVLPLQDFPRTIYCKHDSAEATVVTYTKHWPSNCPFNTYLLCEQTDRRTCWCYEADFGLGIKKQTLLKCLIKLAWQQKRSLWFVLTALLRWQSQTLTAIIKKVRVLTTTSAE